MQEVFESGDDSIYGQRTRVREEDESQFKRLLSPRFYAVQ